MASTTLESAPRQVPFDALAGTYDEQFTNSLIGRAQREAVWRELEHVFRPGQHILEINCGTGVDALRLARLGVEVLACDSSSRMIEVARERQRRMRLEASLESAPGVTLRAPVRFEVVATEEIGSLRQGGSTPEFDGVLSNFAGLNCVESLETVARDLARLLKPGAPAALCLFGPCCAWEILWHLAHGHPRKAFRRLRSSGDLAELGEGTTVRVRYPTVPALARCFAPQFRLRMWKGVGVAVPPSYVEPLARRFPKALSLLARVDRWLGALPLVRGLGDHMLLVFERV